MADSYNELFGLGSHSEIVEAYYDFSDDPSGGTLTDGSSNSYDGDTSDSISESGGIWDIDSGEAVELADQRHSLNSGLIDEIKDAVHTICIRYKPDTVTNVGGLLTLGSLDMNWFWLVTGRRNVNVRTTGYVGNLFEITTANLDTTTWREDAISVDADNDSHFYRSNGSNLQTSTQAIGAYDTTVNNLNPLQLGYSTNGDFQVDFLAIFGSALTADEVDEVWDRGEPLNTASPVLSGTEEVDETLSVTTGTWNSQSNGTITYTYQWTRSNDSGGSGEADISGATSSTYTLVSADEAKYIRCRVRASNDGGYDSGADTNSSMSGAIAAAGGGSTARSSGLLLAGVG